MPRFLTFLSAGVLALVLASCSQTLVPGSNPEVMPAAVIETISQTSYPAVTGADLFAQTFTPSVSGFITKITVYHSTYRNGTPQISFYQGASPTASPLYVQPVAWNSASGPQEVTLDSPVPVQANQTYTFYPEGAGLLLDTSANNTDLYPGGELLIDAAAASATGTGWITYYAFLSNLNPGATANFESDLAFVIVIDDFDATTCAAGTYSDGSSCLPAPAGTYTDTAGQTSATPCPVGTFSAAAGSTSCAPAPAGYYVDQVGQTSATPCPVGTFSAAVGSVSCTDAPIGYYVAYAGQTSATPCPVGQTTATTGSISAAACDTPPSADPGGPYLVAVGQSVPLDSSASSDPDGDPLTPSWTGAGGSITGETYAAGATVGIYDLCLTVNDGIVDSEPVCTYVVVYDSSAGFVTGGGWIDSPAGALTADASVVGKASFGFVSKYKKGQNTPDGNTTFVFSAGDLTFHSSSYDWLVVNQNDGNAQFKGYGSVNGVPGYAFMLWAGDGAPDTFRIKIWDAGDTVVYDNGGTPLGGGSIVIHRGR